MRDFALQYPGKFGEGTASRVICARIVVTAGEWPLRHG